MFCWKQRWDEVVINFYFVQKTSHLEMCVLARASTSTIQSQLWKLAEKGVQRCLSNVYNDSAVLQVYYVWDELAVLWCTASVWLVYASSVTRMSAHGNMSHRHIHRVRNTYYSRFCRPSILWEKLYRTIIYLHSLCNLLCKATGVYGFIMSVVTWV